MVTKRFEQALLSTNQFGESSLEYLILLTNTAERSHEANELFAERFPKLYASWRGATDEARAQLVLALAAKLGDPDFESISKHGLESHLPSAMSTLARRFGVRTRNPLSQDDLDKIKQGLLGILGNLSETLEGNNANSAAEIAPWMFEDHES